MRQWWIPSAKIWVWWCKIGWCQNTVITCNYKWLVALSMQNIPWSNRFISNQDNQVQSLWSWMILSSQFMIRFFTFVFSNRPSFISCRSLSPPQWSKGRTMLWCFLRRGVLCDVRVVAQIEEMVCGPMGLVNGIPSGNLTVCYWAWP
jgi:hypothetical protein